jgi:hypothetical protein
MAKGMPGTPAKPMRIESAIAIISAETVGAEQDICTGRVSSYRTNTNVRHLL